jgi:N-acetylneuraminic acid mutarotase
MFSFVKLKLHLRGIFCATTYVFFLSTITAISGNHSSRIPANAFLISQGNSISGSRRIILKADTNQTDIASIAASSITGNFTKVNWGYVASAPAILGEGVGIAVNGKLYTFGGFDVTKSSHTPTKRAYVYTPSKNNWQKIADLPHFPNGSNFGGITNGSITTDGTNIYIAGGYTADPTGTKQIFGTNQVWRYNVLSNNYTRMPDLPVKISTGQLEYLQGKLHYIGGANFGRTKDLGSHYVLNLYNLNAGWKTLASLPNPRHHAGSAILNGKIYFIGGQHGQNYDLVTQREVDRYDPSTNKWTRVADLPAPGNYGLSHITCNAVVFGQRIIVMGGQAVHKTVETNMVSAYDPTKNIWIKLTPMPQTRHSGISAVLNGNFYYASGSNAKTTFKGMPAVINNIAATGLGDTIDNANITISPPVLDKFQMTVYPNPTINRQVNVKLENFGKNEQITVYVTNISGKAIQKTTYFSNAEGYAAAIIDIENGVTRGIYIVKAISPSGSCTKKLLVNQ